LEFFARRTDAFIKRRALCIEARQSACRFRLRDGQLLDAAMAFVHFEAVAVDPRVQLLSFALNSPRLCARSLQSFAKRRSRGPRCRQALGYLLRSRSHFREGQLSLVEGRL